MRWLREQVREVARKLVGHGMLQRGRARADAGHEPTFQPTAGLRASRCAATCSTSPPRPAGATSSLHGVRFRADHWLLIEDGRIVGAQPGAQRPTQAGSATTTAAG